MSTNSNLNAFQNTWKTFIFNKLLDIEINGYLKRKENTLNALIEKRNEFNDKAFEGVLKKSELLNEVYIRVDIKDKKINEQILKLIIKNCYYLKSIAFNFEKIKRSQHILNDTIFQFHEIQCVYEFNSQRTAH